MYGRGFPADMREVYGVELPEQADDLARIAAPFDWHGLNYYMPATYRTQQRTIKGIGYRYADIIREHRGQARKAA